MAVFAYVYSDTVMVVVNALYIFYENMCELRAFLKKMYFVLLFTFKVFQFRARKERQREKFESIDRATDKKKRSIRRFDVLRVWRSLSFLAAVKERKFERREKASFR